MKLYEAYVYDLNSFNSLEEAIEASHEIPDTQTQPYSKATFETLVELEHFIAGVETVNSLPGNQHFDVQVVRHFKLQMYRGIDFPSLGDAREVGAVYDTKVIVPIEDLANKELLNCYNNLVNRTETCINDGESKIQLLLVHPLFSSMFHRLSDFL